MGAAESLIESVCFTVLMELREGAGGGYTCSIRGLARILDITTSRFTDKRYEGGHPRGLFWRVYLCTPDQLPESLRAISGFNYKTDTEQNKRGGVMLPAKVIDAVVSYCAFDALKPLERAAVAYEVLKAVKAGAITLESIEE
jgi:hypothetical protein